MNHAATVRAKRSHYMPDWEDCRSGNQGNVGEPPEPVRTDGKWNQCACDPEIASSAIGGEELAIALMGLDAGPLTAAGDPGSELPPRFETRRAGPPRLAQNRLPPKNACARASALRKDRDFGGFNLTAKLRPERLGISKLWWELKVQGDFGRHGAIGAEEMPRAAGFQGTPPQQGGQPVDARPVVDALDQPILDGVGGHVHQLAHDGVGVDEMDDAHLLGRPHILPAPAERVLTFGEELVEMLGEGREGAVTIEDHGVMVVGHGARQEHVDAKALRRLGEAVEERVVGFPIGTQQELPLGAAARDHVEAAGDDFAGERHDRPSLHSNVRVSDMRKQPRRKRATAKQAKSHRG